ncbi:MAG: Tat pathway signal protein [Sphingopyxis sp.]|nr:Tat pathway signal protein [Sphingopyxis sp.]
MHIGKANELSRRAFLRRSKQLAVAGSASSFALGLAGIGEAAAFSAGNDYKALVCIFLYGGNDHNSTLMPFDSTNYDLYSAIRGGGAGQTAGGITLARASLAATALTPSGGQVLTNNLQYALAPQMTRLKALFDAGRMAPLLNVGPLIAPLTLAQYNSSNITANPRPAKLFSHNDQQSTWQSSKPEGATDGWGGRMGDLAMSSNANALFTCISATGNAVFLSGQQALTYQVSSSGALAVNGIKSNLYGSSAGSAALRTLMTQTSNNVFEAEYNRVAKRSIDAEGVVAAALQPITLATSFRPATGRNGLAEQLQVVARLIAARQPLGARRQVFMVSMGGFDLHDNLISNQANLMGQLDFAMDAFYRATVELGVADKVTTFTASDFGRTLQSNGDGSDHGWGSHHFIMGGAVNGGRFYGVAPQISVTSPDQVGQGRLLPSISVDQYASTLATWFGVAPSELASVSPNIGRFATSNLGFMA